MLARRAHGERLTAGAGTEASADTTAPAWAPPTPAATPILAVPGGQLALAGATAPVPVFFAFAAAVGVAVFAPIALLSSVVPPLTLAGATIVAVALVALTVGLSVLGTALQYAGLTVSVSGDDLHVDYGLLDKQHLSVPRRRVQQVSIVDNPLRRAIGIVDVTLHSAAAPGGEHAGHMTVIAFPRADVGPFLAFLMQDPDWHAPLLEPRTRAAHRRAIVRRIALLCVPTVVVAVAFFPEGLLSLALAAGAGYAWGSRRAPPGRPRDDRRHHRVRGGCDLASGARRSTTAGAERAHDSVAVPAPRRPGDMLARHRRFTGAASLRHRRGHRRRHAHRHAALVRPSMPANRARGEYARAVAVSRSRKARYARRRKRRMDRVEHDLSDEEWRALKKAWGGCAYCGVIDKPLQRDCVLALSRGGRYTLDNIVPACRSCNTSKCNDEVTGWLRRKRLDESTFLMRHREITIALAEPVEPTDSNPRE